ncbi:MAG: LPS-assembly protein LptD [Chthoniobacterales bacterium]
MLLSPAVMAQGVADHSLGGQPMEITASGGTHYDNGIATAHDNVAIHIGDTDIYADDAEYNTETKEVKMRGHVRIYRTTPKGTEFYVGETGTYNTQTKKLSTNELSTMNMPFFVSGEEMTSLDDGGHLILNGSFTTHDSPTPDFHLHARRMRVYEGDRVILRDVVFYVGKIPIFYWPYVYQSLDDSFNFFVSPSFISSWGPSLLGRVTFPITDNIKETVRLDLRGRRGVALGSDTDFKYGVKESSYARLRTYFLEDQNPLINRTSLPRGSVPNERYRVSLDDRTNFTNDIYGMATITKLSDQYLMQDFYQSEFRVNPKPDNFIAVTKTNPGYALTAWTRFQANNFFETTERLPEIDFDVIRQPIFHTPIYYESDSSFAYLSRNFAAGETGPDGSELVDYHSYRADTFHQFTLPMTYFGWLSVVPRVGFRATYYSETRNIDNVPVVQSDNPLIPEFLLPPPSENMPLVPGGDRLRTIVNTGVEASFKISRTWESAQSRALGLDGLRHIIQPFLNFSWVGGNETNPAEILQFDRYQPSTQLRSVDFPQFTSIDSIANWSIARVGVRNRLQTRRDDVTINWLELETYFDVNFDNPYDRRDYSNLYNRLRFAPVPWASLAVSAQLPAFATGFTEVNTNVHFQPLANLQVDFGHRYLNNNPFFTDSSLYSGAVYYRIDDNWGVGAYERYEAATNILEEQRYSVYRDLTSWVASLGAIIRDNGGVKEYGVLLTFTLKALPKLNLDLNFDPVSTGGTQSGLVP